MTTLLPPILTMEGMELASTVLHHLVVVRSSQVRSTSYVTYVYYNFAYKTNIAPFVGEVDFTHTTQDTDHGAPSSQRVTMTTSDRGRGRGGGRKYHLSPRQSTSSMQSGSESSSSYAHGYSEYLAPKSSTMCNGSMSGRI
jgi:hypothetical protein